MNTNRHAAWQIISTQRLSKAAVIVKRHTSPLDGRKPSKIEWLEWDTAMKQALVFDIDPTAVIERAQ